MACRARRWRWSGRAAAGRVLGDHVGFAVGAHLRARPSPLPGIAPAMRRAGPRGRTSRWAPRLPLAGRFRARGLPGSLRSLRNIRGRCSRFAQRGRPSPPATRGAPAVPPDAPGAGRRQRARRGGARCGDGGGSVPPGRRPAATISRKVMAASASTPRLSGSTRPCSTASTARNTPRAIPVHSTARLTGRRLPGCAGCLLAHHRPAPALALVPACGCGEAHGAAPAASCGCSR